MTSTDQLKPSPLEPGPGSRVCLPGDSELLSPLRVVQQTVGGYARTDGLHSVGKILKKQYKINDINKN
jgi:hypothetical protein